MKKVYLEFTIRYKNQTKEDKKYIIQTNKISEILAQ